MKSKFTKIGAIAILIGTCASYSFASIKGFNASGVEIGHFTDLKCSTGLTCTASAGKLNMVSSPTLVAPLTLESDEIINNTVDDTIEFLSNDEHTTIQATGFEAKNAVLNLVADQSDDSGDEWKLTSVASGNTFTLSNDTSGSHVAKFTMAASDGDITLTGGITGDGGDSLSGLLQAQVASTTAAITIAQCGSTFVSNSADVMALPEASTALGCRLTFICGTADDFDINPDDADIILPTGALTPSTGDAIRCTDAGAGFVLEAVSASQWAVLSTNLTITDVN